MRNYSNAIIKDADLESYLSDKLTTKPNYGYSTEVDGKDMVARWEAAKAAEAEIRKKNNLSAGRGLKR